MYLTEGNYRTEVTATTAANLPNTDRGFYVTSSNFSYAYMIEQNGSGTFYLRSPNILMGSCTFDPRKTLANGVSNADTRYASSWTKGCGFSYLNANGGSGIYGQSQGTGSMRLRVNGNQSFNSDDRIKTHEQPILGALATVNKLKPQTYYRLDIPNEDPAYQAPTTDGLIFESGFIAQDVEAVPELAHLVEDDSDWTPEPRMDADGNEIPPEKYAWVKGLNYGGLLAYFAGAIQELSAENETLKSDVAALKVAVQLLSSN